MDDVDRQLIGLLRDNARAAVSNLAHRLGVSRGTVQNRLDRLVENGDILGFTVRLRADDAGRGVHAITLIAEQAKEIGAVVRALRQLPEAKVIHTCNGRWDIVAEMSAESLDALDAALTRVRQIDGVTTTETIILLTALK
jgi:DNA-binding Lrp family transcriptional regulator